MTGSGSLHSFLELPEKVLAAHNEMHACMHAIVAPGLTGPGQARGMPAHG